MKNIDIFFSIMVCKLCPCSLHVFNCFIYPSFQFRLFVVEELQIILQGSFPPVSTSPPGVGGVYCPASEESPKGEVPRVLGQVFHGIASKLTLNFNLSSHSVVMWVCWKIQSFNSPWNFFMVFKNLYTVIHLAKEYQYHRN